MGHGGVSGGHVVRMYVLPHFVHFKCPLPTTWWMGEKKTCSKIPLQCGHVGCCDIISPLDVRTLLECTCVAFRMQLSDVRVESIRQNPSTTPY